ncbi:3'(2'),5'-bisphosphate nucleotidase CysQ [Stakelama saccharophila]|uniref:3'(2'),5'-bisphosphate nucleotidase CysQ n=1 Tax=Stakelama saccharophila TaxID=3075605 RepID=A0ABZ0B9L7_9SPHN|nr:3'(2'),5'-bisphosphate nucleotidase CysQ [Stakelama sp. W311]WNO53952.1 3'(2'),5'-bisphosphate nucleotidase CysQ [Stakelama sp. W311]
MTETLADAVRSVTADAGALAMKRWRTDFRRWEKSPGNPVCEVDLEVDHLLRQRLGALLPDAGWLSEETKDDASRLAATRIWVVDPIDGTRDYIRGREGWAVSVALIERGQPVVGVLDAPARGEHWHAENGKGAYRGVQRIMASDHATLSGARVPAEHLPKADRDFTTVYKPNSIALRIAMVAAGDADLVATLRWGNEWDIAAAVLIAREAGAAVTDALGQPLAFNSPEAHAFGVLATAPAIHDAARERLAARSVLAKGAAPAPGG